MRVKKLEMATKAPQKVMKLNEAQLVGRLIV